MLVPMVDGKTGGTATGVFEYTLGPKEDGPMRLYGDPVITVITAR